MCCFYNALSVLFLPLILLVCNTVDDADAHFQSHQKCVRCFKKSNTSVSSITQIKLFLAAKRYIKTILQNTGNLSNTLKCNKNSVFEVHFFLLISFDIHFKAYVWHLGDTKFVVVC